MTRMSATRRVPRLLRAGISGVIAAAVFVAVAELLAYFLARGSSPIEAVGAFVIDIVPRPLKEFAITTFGEADKPVLLASLAVAAVIGAAIAGILEDLRRPFGLVLFGVVIAATTAAIVTRASAGPFAFIPPVVAGAAALVVLHLLIRTSKGWAAENGDGTSRRRFLQIAIISSASAVVVGVGTRLLSAATASVTAAREALRLPAPATRVSIPAGAELDVPGISPLFTPNADFYRVDTALTVPEIDPANWSLVIDGMVDERIELTFDDLVGRGLDEYAITMTCVSNEVGGSLLGNALWQGIPVRDLLKLAGPSSDADMVLSESFDGFTASTPLEALTDDNRDAIIAVAMNGEPLPLEHGFPVRMVVPGLYGYVSATKWLTKLTVTRFDQDEAYWTPRGYSEKAPIKMSSRIDTPRVDAPVDAGSIAIAGVAWAQPVGVDRVEVKIDNGDWQQATLSEAINDSTWVQWMLPWDATPGVYNLTVRAYDKNGDLQIEERAPIAPDGSSGWQRSLVTVR